MTVPRGKGAARQRNTQGHPTSTLVPLRKPLTPETNGANDHD